MLVWGRCKVEVAEVPARRALPRTCWGKASAGLGRIQSVEDPQALGSGRSGSNPASATYQMCDFEHYMCDISLGFSFFTCRMEIITSASQGDPVQPIFHSTMPCATFSMDKCHMGQGSH